MNLNWVEWGYRLASFKISRISTNLARVNIVHLSLRAQFLSHSVKRHVIQPKKFHTDDIALQDLCGNSDSLLLTQVEQPIRDTTQISVELSHQYGIFHLEPQTPRGTPYNGLYGEALPERGSFFRLEVYKRVGISRVEVQKRVGKTVKYLEQTHLAADSPNLFKGLLKSKSQGMQCFNCRYVKGVPFSMEGTIYEMVTFSVKNGI